MNTLAYVSLLTYRSYSGYELTRHIQPFWPAKHSQIYPLLACLEQEGYVSYELIVQHDKPDKKIYAITASGSDKLREWLVLPASDPAIRDELVFKTYSLHLLERPADARQLFEQRAVLARSKLLSMNAMKAEIRKSTDSSDGRPMHTSPMFGTYLLIDRGLRRYEAEVEWCEWVLSQLPEA